MSKWFSYSPSGGLSTVPQPISFLCGPREVIGGNGRSRGYHPDDAAMMSAAPELYALITEIEDTVDLTTYSMDLHDRVQAVIAKAEGK